MVIFFDIDGTIVDDRTQVIPESVPRAISRLKEKGHIPVVNTGRPYSHIDPRIRAMDFSAFVCGCGMEVILEGKPLYRNFPDLKLCRKVQQAVRDCRMQVLYEAENGTILKDGDLSRDPTGLIECERMEKKGFSVKEIDSLPEPRFMKLVTFDGEGSRHEEFKTRMEPYFTCIERGHTMLELVKKGCSKAGGMELLLKKLGAGRENTMAMGDSTNDLPMFSMAGHTVCMGGGMEELKAEAEFITAPVLEDGIEKALQHYHLI